MKDNYEEVIDIILTFQQEYDIKDKLIYSGSFVPYLIKNKVPKGYINDFVIFVEYKNIDFVRKYLYKMSKEYLFDITIDSIKLSQEDYGFKIKYENTIVTVLPYSFNENKLHFRSFSISDDFKYITKRHNKIPNISQTSFYRTQRLNEDDVIYVISPEFLLSRIEKEEIEDIETIDILKKIIDKRLYNIIQKGFNEAIIKVKKERIRKLVVTKTKVLVLLTSLLFIIVILYLILN